MLSDKRRLRTSGYIPHTFHGYPKKFQNIYSWSINYSTCFPSPSPKNSSQILVIWYFSCLVFHRWRVLYTYAKLQTKDCMQMKLQTKLHNNNLKGSRTVSSHNPMNVVHEVSNNHLLHDKVMSCCDRLYTHWLHQLLTVGIDVYFIISPLYRICITSFFHFLRHPYIMMLASTKEI
jgi:hypothetical protein